MKIKDQKEHVTLLVQCKCIGAVTQIGIMGFSHSARCQVCRNTHTFSNMPTLCAIHSAKKQVKDIKRENKKRETFSMPKPGSILPIIHPRSLPTIQIHFKNRLIYEVYMPKRKCLQSNVSIFHQWQSRSEMFISPILSGGEGRTHAPSLSKMTLCIALLQGTVLQGQR